ncbi:polysaccharide pyruvyl transferase family protein [Alkalicoccus halolimnae]|uniref:Polysaccharide pyruvyl transferase family protein n=1 Tax=Alkalicoccus halolimnae TaxID=1667239 RepID=A0AAJ8N0E1_9BACI|nr:polysaccharide pyruvyl transferase family protein [Alkalicoccus halolimnae]
MKYIMITGAQMNNKGAQAMLFTTINELSKTFPEHKFIMLSDAKLEDKEKQYQFDIMQVNKKSKLHFAGGFFRALSKGVGGKLKDQEQLDETLKQTDLLVDVSGFALSSKFSFKGCINYLANISMAKSYNIRTFLMPQSFGPFDYKPAQGLIIKRLMKKLLPYAEIIYAREKQGYELIKQYSPKNLTSSLDLVLQGGKYDLSKIFTGTYEPVKLDVKPSSVAVVPNVKTIEHSSKEKVLNVYKTVVRDIVSKQKNVYLIAHSFEDIALCKDIKSLFPDEDNVILIEEEYNSIDFLDILSKFEMVVASRYHATVHSLKIGVPVIVLGWAVKYNELLKYFDMEEFAFRFDENIDVIQLNEKFDKMLDNREEVSARIQLKAAEVKKNTIFSDIKPK